MPQIVHEHGKISGKMFLFVWSRLCHCYHLITQNSPSDLSITSWQRRPFLIDFFGQLPHFFIWWVQSVGRESKLKCQWSIISINERPPPPENDIFPFRILLIFQYFSNFSHLFIIFSQYFLFFLFPSHLPLFINSFSIFSCTVNDIGWYLPLIKRKNTVWDLLGISTCW